jgi:hypothetical protein
MAVKKKRKAKAKKTKEQARKDARKDFKLGIKQERVKKGSVNELGLKAVIGENKRKRSRNYKNVRSI